MGRSEDSFVGSVVGTTLRDRRARHRRGRGGTPGRRALLVAGWLAGALAWSSCGAGSSSGPGGGSSPASALEVTPPTGLACFEADGTWDAATETYRLKNTSAEDLAWSASIGAPWLFLDRSGGTLAPGAEVQLTLAVDRSAAAGLPQGLHADCLLIVNETSGSGTTERNVELGVGPGDQALVTSPQKGLSSAGSQGGGFLPESLAYTLVNTTGAALTWSASADQGWIALSAAGGRIEADERAMLVVSIDPDAARKLAKGEHEGVVRIVNETDGRGSTERSVLLRLRGAAEPFSLTPEDGLVSTGNPGGPFQPSALSYTLDNAGEKALFWTASASQPWVALSREEGRLASGGRSMVKVSIDPVEAGQLAPGVYSASVDFLDVRDGRLLDSRTVDLRITKSGVELQVAPAQGLAAQGPAGGPFAPSGQTFQIQNVGGSSVSWSASADQPWVSLSSDSGLLDAGAATSLIVSVDEQQAGALPVGTYSAVVSIDNQTTGSGTTARSVTLSVLGSAPTSMVSALSQFGITWTFDRPYEVGQFANGDWWVVGPVTIVDVDPPSSNVAGRTKNGSMINPVPSLVGQGYDSAMFAQYSQPGSYSAKANVALDVSASQPLVVKPHSSLVSTISIDEEERDPSCARPRS